jgi:hypothetical protein
MTQGESSILTGMLDPLWPERILNSGVTGSRNKNLNSLLGVIDRY